MRLALALIRAHSSSAVDATGRNSGGGGGGAATGTASNKSRRHGVKSVGEAWNSFADATRGTMRMDMEAGDARDNVLSQYGRVPNFPPSCGLPY